MAVAARMLLLGQVSVGDPVPELEVEVSATTVVLGALASRDWRPMHHDKDFAIGRAGTPHIFMNTQNQAAWFERFLTDWTGPRGRLGRMRFQMKKPVCPGDRMVLSGVVESIDSDEAGFGWLEVAVQLSADGEVKTLCTARVTVPVDESDNPWHREGDDWRP